MDSATAQMDDLSIKHTLEQPLSCSPRPSCPLRLPEILSQILLHSLDLHYALQKAELARFCLVSKDWLFTARPLLYRTLRINVYNKDSGQERGYEDLVKRQSDVALHQLTVQSQKHRELVKGINVKFEHLPPRFVEAISFLATLYRVENLKKIWLLDEGVDFWADLKPAKPSDDVLSRFSDALVRYHKSSLRVLVIPQISLRPIDMHQIFTELKSLEIYKGTVNAPRPSPPHWSHACLHRLYVTRFLDGNDLRFLLANSLETLRYLHLVVTPEQSLIELSALRQLETLAITINYWTETQYNITFAFPDSAFARSAKKDTEFMFASILYLVKSIKELPNLKNISIFPSFTDYLVTTFWKDLFERLPLSIKHLAIGPDATTQLPWSLLLSNRSTNPFLNRLTLTSPQNSLDPRNSSRVYFGVEDIALSHGIKVGWIDSQMDWQGWKERQFYPEGSEEELEDPEFCRLLAELD